MIKPKIAILNIKFPHKEKKTITMNKKQEIEV